MVPPGHFAHVAKTEAELKALANGVQNLLLSKLVPAKFWIRS